MPSKPSQESCVAICKLCIDYLSENRCLQEKGLFRSAVSQTDVRALQSRIHQLVQTQDILAYDKMRLAKLRSEWEPSMIAEVLQTTFKDMKSSLLYEAYDAIISMELSEEDFLCNKQAVQKWICKLSEPSFSLASSFFRLIYNLARFEDSEPSLLQLSYCISPTICRPSSGAYMSIKHMEDLRRIRPIIAFIVENYEEVFTLDLKPTIAPTATRISASQSLLTGKLSEKKVVASKRFSNESNFMSNSNSYRSGSDSDSERTSGGMIVDPPMVAAQSNSNSVAALQSGSSYTEASLGASSATSYSSTLQRTPSFEDGGATSNDSSISSRRSLPLLAPLEFDPLSLDMDFESSQGPSSYSNNTTSNNLQVKNQLNYSEMEWKILELLVCAKVHSFLDIDERSEYKKRGGVLAPAHPSVGWAPTPAGPGGAGAGAGGGGESNIETIYAEQNDAFSKKKRQHTAKDQVQSQPSLSQQPLQQYQSQHQQQRNSLHNMYAGSSSRMKRRKMVVDCKALRAKIFEFEQDFVRVHNRVPKGADRGDMQDTYSRYRDLKRDIRDMAATDIQRVYRGFICRKKVFGRMSNRVPAKSLLNSGSNSHSIRNAANIFLGHGNMSNVNVNSTIPAVLTGSASRSGIPVDLHNRYRDLLFSKRDLKKRLKKFDEDFLEKWGRNPKKSDKESIRPMYQRYHEIKSGLEELKVEIESTYGSLPEDLMDDKESTVTGTLTTGNLTEGSVASSNSNKSSSTIQSGNNILHHSNIVSSSSGLAQGTTKAPTASGVNSRKAFPYSYSISADSSDSDGNMPHTRGFSADNNYLRRSRPVGSSDSALNVLSSDDEGGGGGGGGGGGYSAAGPLFNAAAPRNAVSIPSTTAVSNTVLGGFGKSTIAMNLDVLQAEKRSLHAHLKNYEREFNRTHGRPVMRQEDIQPVAHEYQRYKELKAAIKESQSAFHQQT